MDRETMRYYYQSGLWPIARLDRLLEHGKMSEAEYQEIIESDEGNEKAAPIGTA